MQRWSYLRSHVRAPKRWNAFDTGRLSSTRVFYLRESKSEYLAHIRKKLDEAALPQRVSRTLALLKIRRSIIMSHSIDTFFSACDHPNS